MAKEYSIVCICHILFISSCVDEHLDCFYLLATANNTSMNIGIQVSVKALVFTYSEYIPMSRITGSYC
jgi:hypothetical protein